MDKITKFLLKLSSVDLQNILFILEKIKILDLSDLDVKKLTWEKDLYRIRKWIIRIIFKKSGNSWVIIDINYRDKIYKNI